MSEKPDPEIARRVRENYYIAARAHEMPTDPDLAEGILSHDSHSHTKNARHKAHAEDTLRKLGAGEEYKVKE